MEQMTQIHTNDAQFNGTAIEGKQLLTAEDLLHMQIEDDPFMGSGSYLDDDVIQCKYHCSQKGGTSW